MSTDESPFGDDDRPRRRPSDRDTQPIPRYRGDDDGFDFGALDDVASISAVQAGVGFDRVDLIATREPSDLVRRYLFPTEKFRGEWRRHWIQLVKRLSLGVVATVVLGYLAGFFASKQQSTILTVLVLLWLAVMAWVLWDVVEWYYDRFVLTNKRVMLIEGIVARRVAMMPLQRVTDMKYTQSALGRLLGYGNFVLESAGQDQALRSVPNLPNPTDLYLQVVEEMYEPDASEARRRPAQIDDGI
jgi:membrane protein YdbS with pleckstrin-like domain